MHFIRVRGTRVSMKTELPRLWGSGQTHPSHVAPLAGHAPVEAGSRHRHHEPEGQEVQTLVRWDLSLKRQPASKRASVSVWGRLCLTRTRASKPAHGFWNASGSMSSNHKCSRTFQVGLSWLFLVEAT